MSNIYKKLSVGNLMAMAIILPMVANTTNTASSPLLPSAPDAQKAAQAVKAGDVQILRINPTLVEIVFANQQRVAVDFYGESVFRIFEDHNDGVMRAPEAKPEASILVDNPRTALNHKQVKVEENDNSIILSTTKAQVIFDKATQLFRIINLENGKTVAEQSDPAQFTPEKVTLSLREQPDEYFFGGGVQNGSRRNHHPHRKGQGSRIAQCPELRPAIQRHRIRVHRSGCEGYGQDGEPHQGPSALRWQQGALPYLRQHR